MNKQELNIENEALKLYPIVNNYYHGNDVGEPILYDINLKLRNSYISGCKSNVAKEYWSKVINK